MTKSTPEESKVFYDTQDKLYRLREAWPNDLEALKTVMMDAYDFNSTFTTQQRYDVKELVRFFYHYRITDGLAKHTIFYFKTKDIFS